jgi:ribonuclease D
MFAKLENAIVSKGLNQWVYTESELLGTKKKMQLAADYQYLKLKHNWQLQGQSLHALKHLASWRFLQSQQENKPINFIVKEPVLVEICRLMPTHKGALWSVSGMHSSTIKVYAEPLLEQIRQSMQVAAEAYPPPIQRLIDFPDYKNAMAELKKYSGRLANDYQVPVEVICSKKQAHQLLKYLWFDLDETRLAGLTPDLLSGWRAELFKPCLQQSVYLKE